VAAGKSSVNSDKGGRRAAKKCNKEETDSEDSPDGESDEENPPPNPNTPFFTTHSNCNRTTHREIYYELKRKARALRNAEKKKVYLLHEFFYFSTIFYK